MLPTRQRSNSQLSDHHLNELPILLYAELAKRVVKVQEPLVENPDGQEKLCSDCVDAQVIRLFTIHIYFSKAPFSHAVACLASAER